MISSAHHERKKNYVHIYLKAQEIQTSQVKEQKILQRIFNSIKDSMFYLSSDYFWENNDYVVIERRVFGLIL